VANGALYTPDDDAAIIRIYTEHQGRSGWAIAAGRALGRSAATITKRKQFLAERGDFPDLAASDESSAVQEWTARRDAALAEVEHNKKLYDWLRPVELSPLERPRAKARATSAWIVSSDHHWGCHDERAEAILLQAIEAVRPRGYVLNGDGADLLALSKYPKDARRGKSWELREEQHAAKSWWRSVGSLMQQWDGALYETEANHSGNQIASRWRRWLNENASALFQLDGFEEDCTYQRYFHHPDVPVAMVEEVVIAGEMRVRHGELVRKHGGYSARAHGDKYQTSVMHGHTHRIGSSIKRRPGIPACAPTSLSAPTRRAACALRSRLLPWWRLGAGLCRRACRRAIELLWRRAYPDRQRPSDVIDAWRNHRRVSPQCDCAERHDATKAALFFFWSDGGGWVFVDGPMRQLTRGARYWKDERPIEDHTGEMFVWHCCPFCGLDLPQPIKPLEKWQSDASGDDGC
jgi:hypothetical protein